MLPIEEILKTRFPAFSRQPDVIARPMLAMLRRLMRERDAIDVLARCEGLEGFEFVDRILEHFDFSYSTVDGELENIPVEGRVVIVANHPLGILDGLALLKMVSRVRRDVKIVANDVLLAFDPIRPLLLPVVNLGPGDNGANVRAIVEALEAEQAVIVFPSGEVSRAGLAGIRDKRWRGGFLRFAEETQSPVLPVHVGGRNSALFYGVSTLFRPLSTLMLLREPHAQRHRTLPIRIGEIVPWREIAAVDASREEKIRRMHRQVYEVGAAKVVALRSRHAGYRTAKPIAHPEDRLALRRELSRAHRLGRTPDGKDILLFDAFPDSAVMRELGRLREIAFRQVGEGTGRRRDLDAFDQWYRHVILWDEAELQVVGAYRLGEVSRIVAARGPRGLYTHQLFEFDDHLRSHYLGQSLELGRSFVQPRYQGLRALDYLWHGIGAYLATRPDIRYLFGPVSLSAAYPEAARGLLVHFYRRWFGMPERLATARDPYEPADDPSHAEVVRGEDYAADFRALKQRLAAQGLAIPTLYKQYADLCDPGGTRFLAFNVDPAFANCVDGLVLVDLLRLKPGKRERYLGSAATPSLPPPEALKSA